MQRILVSLAGATGQREFRFPSDCLVGVVVREVAMAFRVSAKGTSLVLIDHMGNPLDPDRTLVDEGVAEDEPMELVVLASR